jgi:Putative beta-barrel porin-2, OmpL-like. bbp2
MQKRALTGQLVAGVLLSVGVSAAAAAEPATSVDTAPNLIPGQVAQVTPAPTPAPAEQPAAPPGPTAMTTPAMAGPLAANPDPFHFDAGFLGPVYVTGAVSGLGLVQSNPVPGDHTGSASLSNGQVFIQKTDGLFQYFVQVGAYTLPALGTPYFNTAKATGDFYGPLPQAFIKIAPTDTFSVMAGKLPTLIGAEYTFSFENMNIERGLLWNQENAVNRGVQANYTAGPVAFALSLNDGFYSNNYNWLWGSATWTIDPANTLSFVGGGNFSRSTKNTLATPVFLNNEEIYNWIYTYNAAPWTITPYFQYTNVPKNPAIGAFQSASTYGGAILANYSFAADSPLSGVSLPVRVEYIASSGSAAAGAPNLIYGPGSDAWSITVTPTYQSDKYFVRAEGSYVQAMHTTPGLVFGPTGNSKSQTRGMLEFGILF